MTRIALVITGVVGTLAAAAPAQPKAAPAATTRPALEVTKETAATWVRNFGKLNYKDGQLTTLGRAEPRPGC